MLTTMPLSLHSSSSCTVCFLWVLQYIPDYFVHVESWTWGRWEHQLGLTRARCSSCIAGLSLGLDCTNPRVGHVGVCRDRWTLFWGGGHAQLCMDWEVLVADQRWNQSRTFQWLRHWRHKLPQTAQFHFRWPKCSSAHAIKPHHPSPQWACQPHTPCACICATQAKTEPSPVDFWFCQPTSPALLILMFPTTQPLIYHLPITLCIPTMHSTRHLPTVLAGYFQFPDAIEFSHSKFIFGGSNHLPLLDFTLHVSCPLNCCIPIPHTPFTSGTGHFHPQTNTKCVHLVFRFLGSKSPPHLFFRSQVPTTSTTTFTSPHMLLPLQLLAICTSQAILSMCARYLFLGGQNPCTCSIIQSTLDSHLHLYISYLWHPIYTLHVPCADLQCIYLNR